MATKNVNQTRGIPQEELDYEVTYRSKLLNKEFTSLDELREAEATYKKENEAKLAAAEKRKTDADLVGESYKAYYNAVKEKTEADKNALEKCQEAIKTAKDEYYQALESSGEYVKGFKNTYEEVLEAFIKTYGSYHQTIKMDDDKEVTISKSIDGNASEVIKSFFDLDKLFNRFFL